MKKYMNDTSNSNKEKYIFNLYNLRSKNILNYL